MTPHGVHVEEPLHGLSLDAEVFPVGGNTLSISSLDGRDQLAAVDRGQRVVTGGKHGEIISKRR